MNKFKLWRNVVAFNYLFSHTKRYDNDISEIIPSLILDITCHYKIIHLNVNMLWYH